LQLARLIERITRNFGEEANTLFSSTWPKPSIPFGSMASFTS
jgi:hypothetical protein